MSKLALLVACIFLIFLGAFVWYVISIDVAYDITAKAREYDTLKKDYDNLISQLQFWQSQ